MIDSTEQQFLRAVFCLSRAARPVTRETIETTARMSPLLAELALIRLAHAGLIDARRMRLTMAGLAIAARLELSDRDRRARIRARATMWSRPHAPAAVARELVH